jgi:glycosyltransferase involved in cell wall biosynthesis
MNKIAIHQFLPSFSPWDAIGNEARLMRDDLRKMGYESDIYCEHRHKTLRNEAIEVQGSKMKDFGRSLLIFHFSVATTGLLRMASSKAAICLRYHNVTPEWFFDPIKDAAAHSVCKLGRRQLPMAVSISRWGLADSAYNAADLLACDMPNVSILPLFRDYDAIARIRADSDLEKSLKSIKDRKTILFVGRLAPNKSQQDLIQILKIYQDCVDKNVRLVLIGGAYSLPFDQSLKNFATELGLRVAEGRIRNGEDFDVLFPGSVSDEDLAAYYATSDVFVSVSEHEGFCVPIVEAMRMGIPILAHDSTAVTETVGDAGLVLNKKEPESFILGLQRVLNDGELRKNLIKNASIRLDHLALPTVKKRFSEMIRGMADELQSDAQFMTR